MIPLAILLFWGGCAVLGFTFVGYKLFIEWLARRRPTLSSARDPAFAPDVTVVIVAYNEEQRIRSRVENLLASSYPPECLQVLVVSDGSTDATVSIVEEMTSPRARILVMPERRGKAAGLNAGISEAGAEIVVLTDARQWFPEETIGRLVAHFTDAKIGAVSGSLEIDPAQSATGRGIGAYWKWEKAIRAAEARWDSCIGCTGAVYAIRKGLFRSIPEDTVLDDVVIPMGIAMQGYRVLHDPLAPAYDPQPLEPEAEKRRKCRTLAGNFQMLFRYPGWLDPIHSRLWWQLAAHKYLRLIAPAVLALVFLSNLPLAGIAFYRATLLGQVALYACAVVGLCVPKLRIRVFAFPAAFVFLNFTTVAAFWHYVRSSDLHRWDASRRRT